jgi:hypothetical protein
MDAFTRELVAALAQAQTPHGAGGPGVPTAATALRLPPAAVDAPSPPPQRQRTPPRVSHAVQTELPPHDRGRAAATTAVKAAARPPQSAPRPRWRAVSPYVPAGSALRQLRRARQQQSPQPPSQVAMPLAAGAEAVGTAHVATAVDVGVGDGGVIATGGPPQPPLSLGDLLAQEEQQQQQGQNDGGGNHERVVEPLPPPPPPSVTEAPAVRAGVDASPGNDGDSPADAVRDSDVFALTSVAETSATASAATAAAAAAARASAARQLARRLHELEAWLDAGDATAARLGASAAALAGRLAGAAGSGHAAHVTSV